jgi:hypothetical protein
MTQPMVAHLVKTPKSAQIRATLLLSTTLCSLKWTVFMPCENTLRQAFGNQVPDEGAPDYKT